MFLVTHQSEGYQVFFSRREGKARQRGSDAGQLAFEWVKEYSDNLTSKISLMRSPNHVANTNISDDFPTRVVLTL